MVKQVPSKGGSAHIRLIVLEAHVPEGEVGQLAQALQNALRSASPMQPAKAAPLSAQLANLPDPTSGASEEAHIEDGESEAEVIPPRPKPPREAKPRKYATPNFLDQQTADEVSSRKQFAGMKSPKNDTERYILAVTWSQKNVAEDGATTDNVFTCYRHMKWPVAIDDFGALLRSLKQQAIFKSPARGRYVPTHLALARIDEMDGSKD